MSAVRSRIYFGSVFHRRLRPRRHELRYGVFYLLLDLDELAGLDKGSRLFSYNRFGLFSFHDRDHGPGLDRPLRPWVEAQLLRAGVDLDGGRILALTLPRVLGHVFNPLTIYFCHAADGRLAAAVYEVSNTFGDRHSYVVPVEEIEGQVVRHGCEKAFFVSPFIDVAGRYDFTLQLGDRLSLSIRESDGDGALLSASFSGVAREFTDRTLCNAFLTHPLLTLKVVGGIHWEALRLWLKGVTLRKRPAPPASAVSIAPGPRRLPHT